MSRPFLLEYVVTVVFMVIVCVVTVAVFVTHEGTGEYLPEVPQLGTAVRPLWAAVCHFFNRLTWRSLPGI